MKQNNSTLEKIKGVHIALLAIAALIILAGVRWQIVDAAKLTFYANQRDSTSQITALRGAIYAKDGTTLAYSEPRYDMFIWYGDLKYFEDGHLQTRQEFLNKVAPIINETPEALGLTIDNFQSQTSPVYWMPIMKSLNYQQWTNLNNLTTDESAVGAKVPLRGVHFQETSKRIYPEANVASQLLGLTNNINNTVIGEGGLEGEWNNTLNSIKGIITQQSNAKGQAIATALTATVEAKNGSSVYTSIDVRLQKTVQDMLKDGVAKYKADSGSVIIMDPKTGQILSLANYPDYDPNTRTATDTNAYGNESVSSPYEMGSIGKVLTIAAAIDLGRVTQNTVILPKGHHGCETFSPDLGPLCTWDHVPKPPMPLKECFSASDNICLFHLSLEHLQPQEFRKYLEAFGIGSYSGVDLAGESYAPLRAIQDWTLGDVAATSFGHGYSVNLVQAATAVGTIANNGVRMKPYVVTKILDAYGNQKNFVPEAVQTVIKPATATQVMSMMQYNYTKAIAPNEGSYRDLLNYNICVKSGTALIATATGYSDTTNATFVGFDCSDQRSFLLIVKLDNPKTSTLAYYNVRPLWLDMFKAIKDIIGVPRK